MTGQLVTGLAGYMPLYISACDWNRISKTDISCTNNVTTQFVVAPDAWLRVVVPLFRPDRTSAR
jgi:hypothetical protein